MFGRARTYQIYRAANALADQATATAGAGRQISRSIDGIGEVLRDERNDRKEAERRAARAARPRVPAEEEAGIELEARRLERLCLYIVHRNVGRGGGAAAYVFVDTASILEDVVSELKDWQRMRAHYKEMTETMAVPVAEARALCDYEDRLIDLKESVNKTKAHLAYCLSRKDIGPIPEDTLREVQRMLRDWWAQIVKEVHE